MPFYQTNFMTAEIFINGVIGQDTDLLSVMHQFGSYSNPTDVTVYINSVGGDVKEGKAIYNYFKALEIPVKTVATMAYSIASYIFLSGDERVVEEGDNRLMLHFAWASMSGRSEDFSKVAKELANLEKEFVQFYSEFLNADEESIKRLLDNETFISGSEALTLNLATTLEIPLKAVAYYNKETNKNTIMQNAEKLINALKSFVGVNTEEGAEVVALVLQDANGVEITFADVADDSEPSIGDTATVDGVPAEGDYVSPEGATWRFEGGALVEVIPAEDEMPEEVAEDAEASADESAEGAEANAEEDSEMDFEVLLEQLFAKAKDSLQEDLKAEITGLKDINTDLNAEIVALKKLMGSKDIEEEEKPKKRKTNFLA